MSSYGKRYYLVYYISMQPSLESTIYHKVKRRITEDCLPQVYQSAVDCYSLVQWFMAVIPAIQGDHS
jgi:hypothetical protein